MFLGIKALPLDMNGTFMFGEDRFGDSEVFSIRYRKIGGTLSQSQVNTVIRAAYQYLNLRYAAEKYRNSFPSVKTGIRETFEEVLSEDAILKIVDTFAFHERGYVPGEYVAALHKLRQHFFALAAASCA